MADKKPKVLDILRLIVAIITLVGALVVGIYLFISIYRLFTYDGEESISGLVLIFLMPFVIGAFGYGIIALKWIKKYKKIVNTPLIQRTNTIGECVVKIILWLLFLKYFAIPFVVYWGLDLIEAIERKSLSKKLNAQTIKPEYKTNETHPIDEVHKCEYCGAEVKEQYAKFCEHCGAEIKYRK